MSEYHCANCGKSSSSYGHYVPSRNGFTCEKPSPEELAANIADWRARYDPDWAERELAAAQLRQQRYWDAFTDLVKKMVDDNVAVPRELITEITDMYEDMFNRPLCSRGPDGKCNRDTDGDGDCHHCAKWRREHATHQGS